MKKTYLMTSAMLLGSMAAVAQTPAFPGAEGFGRYTTGGRGGKIIHVTNLNDNGAGSLRAAVKGNDKKTVVFDVGGIIELQSDLQIGSNTTIAGQTAPGQGITVRYYTVKPNGDNIIIRFLRVRRGQEKDVNDGADAIWTRDHRNIILDHCSFSWSIDEVASFYDNRDFTMQWCTIAEALNNAGHDKGAHGYGGIWGGKGASFHHNLLAHLTNRAPRFNGARYGWDGYDKDAYANTVLAERVDFRNCLMYNWGQGNGCYGGPGGGFINIVNNYYKAGPSTKNKNRVTECSINNAENGDKNHTELYGLMSRYYINGNYVDKYGENYDWKGVTSDNNGKMEFTDANNLYGQGAGATIPLKLDEPIDAGTVTTHSAAKAYEKVRLYAGASLARDAQDTRYSEEAGNGTATYKGSVTKRPGQIDLVADQGGYTLESAQRADGFDSDGDGMPDAWEKANGLNPNSAADASSYTLDPKGYYTNLEVYTNSLVQDIMLAGNADAVSSANEYYPAYTKEDGTKVEAVNGDNGGGEVNPGIPQEKQIYVTDFTEWGDYETKAKQEETVATWTTRYSKESLSFTIYNTQIGATNFNTGKFANWTGGMLMAEKVKDGNKAADPYIITSPLKSITKVSYLHGATGSNRGWALWAKGEGDADWVLISDAVANPSQGATVTADINRTNCQLKFTNINPEQNAYLFQLEIYGNVVTTEKTYHTVTYYDTDGTELKQQTVEEGQPIGEFAAGASDVKVGEGKAFRGWFATATGGRKYTTSEMVASNMKLYAVATDIETASTTKRYTYNLADPYFYDEDHEAINITGGKYYNAHGWTLPAGSRVDLLVGGQAILLFDLCQYSKGTYTLTDADGNVIKTFDAAGTKDGQTVAVEYKGKATTLTLTPSASTYLHKVVIANMEASPVAKNDQGIYVVEAGSADNFLNTLTVANATAQADSRTIIFLPNGTYDLGDACLTPIAADNISIIGQDMEKTIIKNTPKEEGISVSATLLVTGSNTYLQDLTLQNAFNYYGVSTGRAVCLQDKGNRTICKNVELKSYQDTYYSNNDGQFYFEDANIHGTVDFICGQGDVFFRNCTLTVEPRTASGSGECTITAPYTKGTNFGYVFDGCTINSLAERFNYGRAWGGTPRCAYLNTTLLQPDRINSNRWTAAGMNVAADKFVEYNTLDSDGNVVSPATHVMTFTKDQTENKYETILSAEQAAAYALDKVFADWQPDMLASQKTVGSVVLKDGRLTWAAVEGAKTYAVFKNDVLAGFTTETSYVAEDTKAVYTVRALNDMGGLGAAAVAGGSQGISNIRKDEAAAKRYTLKGTPASRSAKGILISQSKKTVVK